MKTKSIFYFIFFFSQSLWANDLIHFYDIEKGCRVITSQNVRLGFTAQMVADGYQVPSNEAEGCHGEVQKPELSEEREELQISEISSNESSKTTPSHNLIKKPHWKNFEKCAKETLKDLRVLVKLTSLGADSHLQDKFLKVKEKVIQTYGSGKFSCSVHLGSYARGDIFFSRETIPLIKNTKILMSLLALKKESDRISFLNTLNVAFRSGLSKNIKNLFYYIFMKSSWLATMKGSLPDFEKIVQELEQTRSNFSRVNISENESFGFYAKYSHIRKSYEEGKKLFIKEGEE